MNMGVTSVISALWKPRQEYQELEASLGCRTKLSIESQNLRMRKGVEEGQGHSASVSVLVVLGTYHFLWLPTILLKSPTSTDTFKTLNRGQINMNSTTSLRVDMKYFHLGTKKYPELGQWIPKQFQSWSVIYAGTN